MSKDPYSVLGVAKTASQDDIRKAYRKLAKELHPDLNPGDKKAEERFREVSGAYDILGDKDKRARFDRGEIDASGQERPEQRFYREYADTGGAHHYRSTAGFEDLGDISDLFGDLFRRAQAQGGGPRGAGGGRGGMRMKGQDVSYRLEVGFLDAVKGAKKRITLPDGSALDLTVPEGVADGQTLRLKGKGGPGLGGGPAGDALVEISVKPHPLFERRGDDIHMVLPITVDEAVLGGKVETPTVSGKVALSIPKGASGGQVLRLKGRGVKHAKGGGHGDQLVELRIVMPSEIDAELAEFMQSWRDKHGYDPRSKMKVA